MVGLRNLPCTEWFQLLAAFPRHIKCDQTHGLLYTGKNPKRQMMKFPVWSIRKRTEPQISLPHIHTSQFPAVSVQMLPHTRDLKAKQECGVKDPSQQEIQEQSDSRQGRLKSPFCFAGLVSHLSGLYPQAWGKTGVDAGTKTLHNYIQERRKEKLVRSKKILLAPIPLLTLQWLEPNGHVSFGKSTTSGEMKSPMLAQGGKSRRPQKNLG